MNAKPAGGQAQGSPNGRTWEEFQDHEDTLVRVGFVYYVEPEPIIYETYDKYHGYTQWPIPSKEDSQDLVRSAAIAEGAPVSRALSIVNCESGFDSTARNNISSASGLYQFIRGTWEGTAMAMGLPEYKDHKQYSLNAEINARFGAFLLANSGPTHWECYNLGITN